MSAKSQTQTFRRLAFDRQGGRCFYCGVRMWQSLPDELNAKRLSPSALAKLRCTAEHLVARCDGGMDAASNIVAACAHCNHTRHKRKVAPEPSTYRVQVQGRMACGGWHHRPIFELGLAGCKPTKQLPARG